jgi:hypothetical protein
LLELSTHTWHFSLDIIFGRKKSKKIENEQPAKGGLNRNRDGRKDIAGTVEFWKVTVAVAYRRRQQQ